MTSAARALDGAPTGLGAARGVILGLLLATALFWVPLGAAAWWLLA